MENKKKVIGIVKRSKYIEEFVKKALSACDSSHNFQHCKRVAETSLHISKLEKITDEKVLEIIYVSSLLHDVEDHKYIKEDEKGKVKKFLTESKKFEENEIEKILKIIGNISFKKEDDLLKSGDSVEIGIETKILS